MKAAVLESPGNMRVTDFPTQECPEGGILVRITACGVCSADVKMLRQGHSALTYPRILGHEIVGRIAESRTPEFRVGERVQISPGLRCGRCIQCKSGSDNRCVHREIFGFTRHGGFAEYLAVPLEGSLIGNAVRLPDHLSNAVATLAEPLACCIHAQEMLGVKPDDFVWIIGAGPLGLLHCLAAQHCGAATVCISEIRPERRENARQWADHVVDARDGYKAINELTGGLGANIVILACPQAVPDDRLLDGLAPGGRVSVFCGTGPPISRLSLELNRLHYRELNISGSYGCTAQNNRDAIAMLSDTRLPVDSLITGRIALESVLRITEMNCDRNSLKTILEVNRE